MCDTVGGSSAFTLNASALNVGVCILCRARATADAVTDEVLKNGVDLVLHVGDISYANGDPEVTALCVGTCSCRNCLYEVTVQQSGACLWSVMFGWNVFQHFKDAQQEEILFCRFGTPSWNI